MPTYVKPPFCAGERSVTRNLDAQLRYWATVTAEREAAAAKIACRYGVEVREKSVGQICFECSPVKDIIAAGLKEALFAAYGKTQDAPIDLNICLLVENLPASLQ